MRWDVDALMEEMGEKAFEEWLAFELLESGQYKPDESDLPAIAARQLEMMKGRR
jgi:hypothetical protein